MNPRTSVILLVTLALVAGYVYFVQIRESPEPKDEPPWFYSIDMGDISRITVVRQGEEAAFVLGKDQRWYFQEPEGLPVNMDRWGGVTLLLSGPKASRLLLEEQPTDLAPYGLDSPPMRIQVDLKDGQSIPLLLGLTTPNGVDIYAQMEGFPQIFTVVANWRDVMARLISEPPYPLWYRIDTSIVIGIELRTEEQAVILTKDQGSWRFDDEKGTPVDEAQLPSILTTLEKPLFQKVVEPNASDISKYGLDNASLSLLVRTQYLQEEGIKITNEILIKIGQPTEDGKGYYSQASQEEGIPDVLQVDAIWVEALRAIVAHPPYPPTVSQGSTG